MMDDDEPDRPVVDVPSFAELSPEQQERILQAQRNIDAIWDSSRKGDYVVDDEGWRSMPIFMEDVSEEAVESNPACAALASLVYDSVPPEEVALNRKEQGNKMIQLALQPGQEKVENVARAAYNHYTEGIKAGSSDRKINAQLYANRSLAQFLRQNYGHGLEDAQRSIILDPQYSKAYYRGAKCAEKIRKLDIAKRLITEGLSTNPPPGPQAVEEFQVLLRAVDQRATGEAQRIAKEKAAARAEAASSTGIVRTLHSKGITVSNNLEVKSEQWAQNGYNKPYYDEEGILQVPLLILYDEYSTTDFMKEVGADCSMRDVLETLMPFPWDTRGRYANIENLAVVFLVDDGVAMPKYFTFDIDWQLYEVFRSSDYVMPGLLPCIHVLPKDSPILTKWEARVMTEAGVRQPLALATDRALPAVSPVTKI